MSNIATRVLFILLVALLIINIFAYKVFETTTQPVMFSDFLEQLSDAPQIELSLDQAVSYFRITDEWAILDGVRLVINALGSVIGFLVYLVAMLINVLSIVGWFLYLLGLSSTSAIVPA